jgi:hypothetical protein
MQLVSVLFPLPYFPELSTFRLRHIQYTRIFRLLIILYGANYLAIAEARVDKLDMSYFVSS